MSGLIQTNNITMTLKEITDLLEVRHNDAMKTIEKMALDKSFGTLRKTRSVYNEKGQEIDTYDLDKRQSLAVSAKLNTAMLMAIIDRWQELEANQNKPLTYAESLRQLADTMDERDAAKEQVSSLEIELDQSKEYCTIKRMEMIHHGQKFKWGLLKTASNEMALPPKDVFDENYGTVKAYHLDAWREAYAVTINEVK